MQKFSMKRQSVDLKILIRVIQLTRPYTLLFAGCLLLAIILAPVGILKPWLINVMVDDYIFRYDLQGMTNMAILLVGVLLLETVLRYGFMLSSAWLGQNIIRDLRIRVFNHISSLRLSYFDRTPIGRSTTRTINDVETINQIFSQGVLTIVADILGIIAVLSIMLWTSWQLTLVVLTVMPILMIGSYIFKEKVRVAFQAVRNQISIMNSFLQERISGIQVVQVFNAEKQERDKFRKINRAYTQANLNSILYYAIFFPFVEIVSAASLGLLVWYGSRGVLDGSITLGVLIAFPLYINMLFRPIRMMANRFNTLQMGLVAAGRVFDVLDKREFIPNKGLLKPEKLKGKVEFDRVWFSYDDKTDILKEVSFKIDPGDTLAIVGSTGSGKTTIINLITRFYDIRSGNIRIDGEDIRRYELNTLRSRIALVLQDVFLFGGSIYENISLRDPNIRREEMRRASEIIGADKIIEKLPGGYNFQITERGSNLSLGQRQLISFVRALVFKPDILILDEATSSVDTETESLIQHAIEKLITRRTSIIIAHRLSTIRHADHIAALKNGKIIEYGKPADLLANEEGYYRKLYDKQFIPVS
ncbi:MAG: ABC transporter ATP-binding protein [Saprospirales bacterium]|nr:MAG: ABC transporter ATP-binding protein [Saprospirales bacterium]